MNITVYLGANPGRSDRYRIAAEALGKWIGENGHSLIYGGSRVGLMGILSESALKAGASVIGVEPAYFVEQELQHEGVTELVVVDTMDERKQKMIELGDAFIAFPGGTGTLEEITQIMSMSALPSFTGEGTLSGGRPCILFNLDGYYDDLKQLLKKMIREGFSSEERQSGIQFADSLEEIEEILSKAQK